MPGYDEGKFEKVTFDVSKENFSTIAVSTGSATVVWGSVALKFGPPDVAMPPDDHPIYSMIGRIASNWGHVERMFDQIIWDLAEVDGEKGACITTQLSSIPAR